jgi:3-oxoacyl-[acyl-carrier protein] reductase
MHKTDKNKKRNRNIINVSSISGLHVYRNQGAYAPSKAALNLLTRYQAVEFAEYNIRVNAIAPTGFPSIISTESVADALREMDQSSETGLIKVMDSKSPS